MILREKLLGSILAFVLVLSSACATTKPAIEPHRLEESIVERYFAAFNRHDLDGVVGFYSTDAVMIDPNYEAPVRGHNAIREHIRKLFEEVPDIKDEVRSIVSQPGRVAIEFVATGTPKGAPSGFAVNIATFFQIANGKIVRDATYFDRSK